jgi:hypothetical protein
MKGRAESLARIFLMGAMGLLTSSCMTTEWVHPNKAAEEYIADYNKCQASVLQDPKVQQGGQLITMKAIDRCLQKEGWRLIER